MEIKSNGLKAEDCLCTLAVGGDKNIESKFIVTKLSLWNITLALNGYGQNSTMKLD